MLELPFLCALTLLAPAPDSTPGRVVLHITAAVEADSADALRARLRTRLQRTSADPSTLFQLATLERLTYHPEVARALYIRVLTPDSAANTPLGIGATLGLAQLDIGAGRWDAAQRLLRDAAQRAAGIRDASLEAEARLDLAPVLARTSAEQSSDSLLALVARWLPAGDDRLWARLRCARAGPPRQDGELEEADEVLAGLQLARTSGDRRLEALCRSGYAKALFRKGLVDSAIAVNGRAMAQQREVHDIAGLAAALQWQGYALVAAREYGPARQALLAALDACRASGNWLPAGVALVSLTSLSVRFGELGGARRYAAWGDSLLGAQGNERGRTSLLAVRGDLARASGDTMAARLLYTEALARAQRFGGYGTVAPMRGLAALARLERNWASAAARLDSARATARQQGMKSWARRLDFDAGSLALAQGNLGAAEREYRTFLAGLAADDRALALPARLHLAEIEARRGEVAVAESLASAAFDDLDAWRLEAGDRTLRLQAMALRELDLDAGLGLPAIAAAMVAHGRAEAALALVERERARELVDAELRLMMWAGSGDGVARPVAGGSQPQLGPTMAVIEFVVGSASEPTLAFLLTQQGVEAFPGPPAAGLAAAATRFQGMVEAGVDPVSLDPAVSRALVGTVLDAVPAGVTTLLVVPDGALHRVPFDALRLASGALAVERYDIIVAPSLGAARSLSHRAGNGADRVLALANPSYDGAGDAAAAPSAETALFRRAFTEAGGLPPLPASAREARRAGRLAPSPTVRLGPAASEAWLKQATLRDYSLIHIGAHAVVSDDDLGGSAIALAPGGGEDGFMTAADLAALSLGAELVVLSGCQTAGGVVVAGEGMQGLTSPILRAGARAVLATGWSIQDRDAARFMDFFYAALQRDGRVVAALGAAKRSARAARMPASVWADFVVVGSPDATVGPAPRLTGGW